MQRSSATQPLIASSDFIGTRDVAHMLQVSIVTVQRYVSDGRLPHYRYTKCLRFKRAEILAFAEASRRASTRTGPMPHETRHDVHHINNTH